MGNGGPQIVNTPTSQNFQQGFCGQCNFYKCKHLVMLTFSTRNVMSYF